MRYTATGYTLADLMALAKRGAQQAAEYVKGRTVSVASDETFEQWVSSGDDRTLMEYVEWRRS